ncbi:ABC transporter substrate-binding protein [Candidatus Aerophobetes bacterium]|nr:ABC transporter substrate-binding protein [Candidatus Aerophobetes bacterium]
MVKKFLLAVVLGIVVIAGSSFSFAQVKNPDTLIIADIGTVDSFDPAWAYDTSSGARIFNIYETLITFKNGKTDEFVPLLATEVPTVENGLISPDGLTYRFPIRKGVKFHNGEILTPEDVEYSFERAMVQDRDGGPVWMLYEPLLGIHGSRDENGNIVVDFKDIDRAVEVEGDSVVFHLKQPYPPFLAILANTWASIVNKKFCVENGDWPGTPETWEKYNNPEPGKETLHKIACGTGPFMLERWEPGVETSLVRFEDYWRGPARLKRAVWKVVEEWTTRKLMFLAGDADIVYVPHAYVQELEGVEGINVVKNLPALALSAAFFNFKINPEGNADIGSGKLDGKGIPPDFFADKDVRLGFAYSFDWETYLRDVFHNEALQPVGPIPEGIAFRNPKQETFYFDPEKAKEHFKKAWGGEVWEKGFKFTILYNSGNTQREIAARIFEENVEALNPKFQIEVRPVDWSTYLKELVNRRLTLFIIGWLADYADPHNFVHPFMHSQGDFSGFQSYYNPIVDELIARGIRTVDPEKRRSIYYQLQWIYHEDVPSVPLYQELLRHYERDWVKGWYYNPIYPNGELQGYLYPISKG